jgi:hypothetical protein
MKNGREEPIPSQEVLLYGGSQKLNVLILFTKFAGFEMLKQERIARFLGF